MAQAIAAAGLYDGGNGERVVGVGSLRRMRYGENFRAGGFRRFLLTLEFGWVWKFSWL